MPANYGMLLMKRDREQYTALHLAATPVSGFMSNGNYCALMALIHGEAAPKAQVVNYTHIRVPSFMPSSSFP